MNAPVETASPVRPVCHRWGSWRCNRPSKRTADTADKSLTADLQTYLWQKLSNNTTVSKYNNTVNEDAVLTLPRLKWTAGEEIRLLSNNVHLYGVRRLFLYLLALFAA